MADAVVRDVSIPSARRIRTGSLSRHRSIVGFLFALPLITVILALVVYPAGYAINLAMLNKSMQHFVGFSNFTFLFKRNTFWMVVEQSCLFAVTAVLFKAVIGFVVAHFVHNIPAKGQRKWRGMLLVPWVIPPAMSTLAWLWLFDPSYSAFNWILVHLGLSPVAWLGERLLGAVLRDPGQCLGRLAVLLDHVSGGAEIGAGAAARGRRDRRRQLVQKIWYINLPMMRNIIADHRAVLADRHLRQFRHRRDLDQWRPGRSDACVRDLGVQASASGAATSRSAPPCRCSWCRSSRSPRSSSCATSASAATRPDEPTHRSRRRRRAAPASYGSISRDRRWALRWSYFFLVLFAIFFLMPPLYMLMTSLKIERRDLRRRPIRGGCIAPTLANYIALLTEERVPDLLPQLGAGLGLRRVA